MPQKYYRSTSELMHLHVILDDVQILEDISCVYLVSWGTGNTCKAF